MAAAKATLEAMLHGGRTPNGVLSAPGLSTPLALREGARSPSQGCGDGYGQGHGQGSVGSAAALLASANAATAITAASAKAVVQPVGAGGPVQVPYERLKGATPTSAALPDRAV